MKSSFVFSDSPIIGVGEAKAGQTSDGMPSAFVPSDEAYDSLRDRILGELPQEAVESFISERATRLSFQYYAGLAGISDRRLLAFAVWMAYNESASIREMISADDSTGIPYFSLDGKGGSATTSESEALRRLYLYIIAEEGLTVAQSLSSRKREFARDRMLSASIGKGAPGHAFSGNSDFSAAMALAWSDLTDAEKALSAWILSGSDDASSFEPSFYGEFVRVNGEESGVESAKKAIMRMSSVLNFRRVSSIPSDGWKAFASSSGSESLYDFDSDVIAHATKANRALLLSVLRKISSRTID
jgi:hypothetical protein